MPGMLDRLRKGERCWPAELALRGLGLAALTASSRAALLAHRLITAPPAHSPTLGEFAVCAATVLLLTTGIALTFEGAGLFLQVPFPASNVHS